MSSPVNLMSVLHLQTGPTQAKVGTVPTQAHPSFSAILDNSNILLSLLMKGIFQLSPSVAMDFMVALGKRVNPCHVQKKKRMQALIDLYLAPTLSDQ